MVKLCKITNDKTYMFTDDTTLEIYKHDGTVEETYSNVSKMFEINDSLYLLHARDKLLTKINTLTEVRFTSYVYINNINSITETNNVIEIETLQNNSLLSINSLLTLESIKKNEIIENITDNIQNKFCNIDTNNVSVIARFKENHGVIMLRNPGNNIFYFKIFDTNNELKMIRNIVAKKIEGDTDDYIVFKLTDSIFYVYGSKTKGARDILEDTKKVFVMKNNKLFTLTCKGEVKQIIYDDKKDEVKFYGYYDDLQLISKRLFLINKSVLVVVDTDSFSEICTLKVPDNLGIKQIIVDNDKESSVMCLLTDDGMLHVYDMIDKDRYSIVKIGCNVSNVMICNNFAYYCDSDEFIRINLDDH